MKPDIGEGKLEQNRLVNWRSAIGRWMGMWRGRLSPGGRQVITGDDLATIQKVRALSAGLSSIWGGSRVVIIKRLSSLPCEAGMRLLKSEFERSRYGGSRGHTIQLARGCTERELGLALKLAGGVKWSVRVPARLAVFRLLSDGCDTLCSAEDFVLKGGHLPIEVEVFGASGPDWKSESA